MSERRIIDVLVVVAWSGIMFLVGDGVGRWRSPSCTERAEVQREHAAVVWLRHEGWYPSWSKVDSDGIVRMFPIKPEAQPLSVSTVRLHRIYEQAGEIVELRARLAQCRPEVHLEASALRGRVLMEQRAKRTDPWEPLK